MILRTTDLDEPRFSAVQCDALFSAVLVNDEIDPITELPDVINIDFDARQLIDCFRLCRQLWKATRHKYELGDLARKLVRDGDLDETDRLRFKHLRAKFKQLRFAYALYDRNHSYPNLLHRLTTKMGRLQDAYKIGNAAEIRHELKRIHFLLTLVPQYLLTRETNRLSPCSSESFHRYVAAQVDTLRGILGQDAVTGAEFHATRKIISRQVSFYDALRTIEPTPQAFMMSRSLAAINGLMGQMHDDLVAQRAAGTHDYYHGQLALPDPIRTRLRDLTDRYPG